MVLLGIEEQLRQRLLKPIIQLGRLQAFLRPQLGRADNRASKARGRRVILLQQMHHGSVTVLATTIDFDLTENLQRWSLRLGYYFCDGMLICIID